MKVTLPQVRHGIWRFSRRLCHRSPRVVKTTLTNSGAARLRCGLSGRFHTCFDPNWTFHRAGGRTTARSKVEPGIDQSEARIAARVVTTEARRREFGIDGGADGNRRNVGPLIATKENDRRRGAGGQGRVQHLLAGRTLGERPMGARKPEIGSECVRGGPRKWLFCGKCLLTETAIGPKFPETGTADAGRPTPSRQYPIPSQGDSR